MEHLTLSHRVYTPAGILPNLKNLKRAEFVNVEFHKGHADLLSRSPLVTLNISYNPVCRGDFFWCFKEHPGLIARLQHLEICAACPAGTCCNEIRHFFSSMRESDDTFRLESADICLDDISSIAIELITRFLHDKCRKTLRTLKMRGMYFARDLIFPALESLTVMGFIYQSPSLHVNGFSTRPCFPNLKTLRIQGVGREDIVTSAPFS